MFECIQKLRQANSSDRWARPEHEQERVIAIKIGLGTSSHIVQGTHDLYLDINIPNPADIGAIMLVDGNEEIIIHPSTKFQNHWQASWVAPAFREGKATQYPTLQIALDRTREYGYALFSVMDSKGKLMK